MQREINLAIYEEIWIWRAFFAVIYAGLGQMPFALVFPRECISIGIGSMSQDKRGFTRTEHIKCEKSGMTWTIGVKGYHYK